MKLWNIEGLAGTSYFIDVIETVAKLKLHRKAKPTTAILYTSSADSFAE